MKFNTAITFLLLCHFAFAQMLRNETTFYNKIKGDSIFTLADSSKVYLDHVKNSWYPAKAVVLVDKINWNAEDSMVNAGATIYDADKNEIGKTMVDLKATGSRLEDKRKYRKHVWVSLSGFIYNRNVHYKSIPEKGIEKIINAKSRGGLHEKLVAYFEDYGFKKVETSNYTYWVYIDGNASVAVEKPYRVIVVFRGETSLYCVVTNQRPFEMEKLKAYKENGAGNFYFVSKPTDKTFEEITDQVYFYIPL